HNTPQAACSELCTPSISKHSSEHIRRACSSSKKRLHKEACPGLLGVAPPLVNVGAGVTTLDRLNKSGRVWNPCLGRNINPTGGKQQMRAGPMRNFACSDRSVVGIYWAREYRIRSSIKTIKSGQTSQAGS
uniref:Uncharacterized protein n=1 Tax=Romanomermis culicivorax TaxID=13658 RepID=A0A915I1X5_ROMCU